MDREECRYLELTYLHRCLYLFVRRMYHHRELVPSRRVFIQLILIFVTCGRSPSYVTRLFIRKIEDRPCLKKCGSWTSVFSFMDKFQKISSGDFVIARMRHLKYPAIPESMK